MKIVFVRQTVLPALLVLSPVVFAADEQTMIVSAAPQVVSELDTPAAVSVVDGEEMRLATPRINLSESLTGVTAHSLAMLITPSQPRVLRPTAIVTIVAHRKI